MFSEKMLEQISGRFPTQIALLGDFGTEVQREIEALPLREQQALKFLYSTMPLSDMQNYPLTLFLDYVKHGIYLYDEIAGVRDMPEDIFLHYILYHRVNNESLVSNRRFFFDAVYPRISDLLPTEAIIEANYWCAEEASYQATDGRTSSPMTVYHSAMGRCGEESTFVVHVLRGLGIPARQVYVPRWSHTDDNHAWVEVWTEGDWYYLGACEPEEVLNRGWFNNASTRAMLVHSRKFDPFFQNNGEIATDCFGSAVQLGQLHRYTDTKELVVTVIDATGTPIPGAIIRFEVVNYSELSPLAELRTDDHGRANIVTGLGSVHIHASYKETMGQTMVGPEVTSVRLSLAPANAFPEGWQEMNVLAPPETAGSAASLSEEQKKNGQKKLDAANERRELKISQFYPPGEIEALVKGHSFGQELEELLRQTRGNFGEIKKFLEDSGTGGVSYRKKQILSAVATKDLYDTTAEILLAHMTHAEQFADQFPEEVFVESLLNPRIALENLTMYRQPLEKMISPQERAEIHENPASLWEKIQTEIKAFPKLDYPTLMTFPAPCLQYKTGSEISRKILFVAICRTLGIPAGIRKEDSLTVYYKNGSYHTLGQDGLVKPEGSLTILAGGKEWKYRRNWTLGRLQDGVYSTINLRDYPWDDDRMTIDLEAGQYRLMTATRLTNGDVWANTNTFYLEKGEHKEILLVARKAGAKDLLQDIALDDFTLKQDGKEIKASALVTGPAVYLWVNTSEEPTEHILNEILENKEGFQRVQERMVFVLSEAENIEYPTLQKVLTALPKAKVCIDPENQAGGPLARRTYLDPDTKPFILVSDSRLHGIYSIHGYNVGTGDMLLTIMDLVADQC